MALLPRVRDELFDEIRREHHQDPEEEGTLRLVGLRPIFRQIVSKLANEHGLGPYPSDSKLSPSRNTEGGNLVSPGEPLFASEDLLHESERASLLCWEEELNVYVQISVQVFLASTWETI